MVMALVGVDSVGGLSGLSEAADESLDAQWEKCANSGASTGRGIHLNPASVLLEHSVNGGEAHPSTLTRIFGRKKRLKNSIRP